MDGMQMKGMLDRIRRTGVIPVATLWTPQESALPLCGALMRGGVDIIEVTLRTEGALDAIRDIKREFPDMAVGAGTVLSEGQMKEAQERGADFFVSPGFSDSLAEYSRKRNLLYFPGCTTATDYQSAAAHGIGAVKFFPAEQSGGVARIKALHAPFRMISVIPTGGISLDNIAQYMACPYVIACGGSYMVADRLVEQGLWDEISELCKRTLDKVAEVRENG